jgi:hypothetical protein
MGNTIQYMQNTLQPEFTLTVYKMVFVPKGSFD